MVRALIEAVQTSAVAPAAFVARSRVDVARLDDPYSWFALEEFDELVAAAVEMTDDPAFGLHWGARSPLAQFDVASPLTATAPTLRSAILVAIRVQAIFLSHPPLSLREDRDRCTCVCKVIASNELGLRVGTELALTGLVRLVRYYAEDAVRRINVAYARPSYGAEYEGLLGRNLYFDQPETSLELDAVVLDRPVLHRNTELHNALLERSEQIRERVLGQMSTSEKVKQHVRTALPQLPVMAEVARALELSERSLRRRLVDEGTTYNDLVDEVQCELARVLLGAGRKPAKQMAAALGFDSVSGFQRAFQRWNAKGTP